MKKFLFSTFKLSFEAWMLQVKLTVPVLIVVRLLMWFDILDYIALPFQPVMGLIGLPKEMALVWVSAMLSNNYTALVVYVNILPVTGALDVAQATVLGSLILIAHNMGVEGAVCRGAGVSPLRVTVLRILSAILLGFLLCQFFRWFGLGQEKAEFILTLSTDPVPPWGLWLWGTIKSLLIIFAIVWVLLVLMAIMRKIGLLKIFTLLLRPLMRLAGVGPKATMITVIGMLLGLAYGGGLIIAESKTGNIPKHDIYGSIILMAMCHSLLEDTALMASMGGSLWGLLFGRLALGVLLAGLIIRLAKRPPARAILIGKKYYA
jgi:spore maturation protein SpmB